MARFQNSYLVDNFSECDGCNNLFNDDEIIPSAARHPITITVISFYYI